MQRLSDRAPRPPMPTDVVPFIARWSGESHAAPVVMRQIGRRGRKTIGPGRRQGIGYAGERSFDRADGVLWVRAPSGPGKGKPEYGKVHSLRQRIAMAGLRCQVCGGAADRNADGVLWLVDAEVGELRPGDERTSHPPVCVPCARRAVSACPHLRKAWVALRVRSPRMWGVSGALYRPSRPVPVAVDAGPFAFGDPLLPWVVAHQLVAQLRDFTVTEP